MKKIFIVDNKFNDGDTCTQSYAVAVKKASDLAYSPLPPQYSSPIVVDNLEDDTAYNVRITRTCCGGVVSDEFIVNVTTEQIDTPTTFVATPGDDSVSLNWDDVSGATGYSLERGLEADYSDAIEIYNGATSAFNNTGLTGGTLYYFRVRAYQNGFLASDYATDSATPS